MASSQPDLNSDDYYKVLGVGRDASDTEINKAYRQLARKHHPDKHQENKAQAEENFKRISEAYGILSDAERRKAYDQFGKDGPSGGSGAGHSSGGFSAEDAEAIFRTVFGGGVSGMPSGASGRGRMPFMFTSGNPSGGLGGSGINIDIDNLFQVLGGSACRGGGNVRQGGKAGCGSAQRAPAYALPAGTAVVIRGLASSAQHNGKTGSIREFDEMRGRYQVSIEDDARTLSLRPQNLTQQCSIEVVGLESKPELNGKMGDIFNYQAENGRYMVLLESPQMAIALQRHNCILEKGIRIVLEGLANQKFNGQMAQIVDVDRSDARYIVRCKSGEQIRVKYDKVLC